MYKLDLPLDYKEAAAIERRRNQEAQRKSRIFNAKVRTIGIDKQGLEQQVHDRKQMELMEKKRDEAFRKCYKINCTISNYNNPPIHKYIFEDEFEGFVSNIWTQYWGSEIQLTSAYNYVGPTSIGGAFLQYCFFCHFSPSCIKTHK